MRIALLALILFAALSTPAHADYLYTFTGADFSQGVRQETATAGALLYYTGDYLATDRVSGSLLVSESAVPQYRGGFFGLAIGGTPGDILAFDFTDGHQTWNDANAVGLFTFSTGATLREPTPEDPGFGAWQVILTGASGSFNADVPHRITKNVYFSPDSYAQFGGGSWTAQRVPEPQTLVLVVTGLLGLGLWRRHRTLKPAGGAGAVPTDSQAPRSHGTVRVVPP